MRQVKVTIIIVNFNGKSNTLDCLESLKIMRTADFQTGTIVVDNASTDDSVKVIAQSFPEVKIIENKENLGFAEGNNVGIKKALADEVDFVLLLNNDTLVSERLLVEMVKVVSSDSAIGIVSPKIYFAPGYEFHKQRYTKSELGKVIWFAGGKIDWQNMHGVHLGVDEVDHGQFDRQKEIDFATGCCFLARAQVFKKVGLFDKKLFLYEEDLDFSIRIKHAGYKIVYVPKAFLWHKNAGSSGSGSLLHDYYITRNRLVIGLRWAPWRTKVALLKESVQHLVSGRLGEKWGIRDFYLGRLGKGNL